MAPDIEKGKAPRERKQTDESLRQEREKADLALAESQEAVDEDADEVIRRAREEADAVLDAARDKADRRLDPAAPDGLRGSITQERVMEDEAVEHERAVADENLRNERAEDARALLKLLPLEREATDRHLLTERARSDDAVSNRDDFLGIVSHDLRNLLSGIVMSAALLSKNAPENEEAKQTLVARIQRYAANMNRLIGDLVDVASIDAGKLAVTAGPGDATAAISEAVDTFQAAAAAKSISLHSEIVEGPLPAVFDHDRLLQVLANLITNSIKFTPEGGRIWVRGERAGDGVCLSVSDSGIGVPVDRLDAVFERFWQVGKDDRRGLGLGLYISRCLVEAHGGRIWAESEPGQGTKVSFSLPA
jgi:signal transduction histidine kinase